MVTGLSNVFVYVALLLAAATVSGALAVYAFRHREVPGAAPFVLLMASGAVWSTTYAAGSLVADPDWRLVIEWLQWPALGTSGLWLLLFALAYTGYDEYLTRRSIGALSAVPVLTVFGAWTNSVHGLMWTDYEIILVDGFVVVDATLGPLVWLSIAYTWVAVLVSAVLFVRLVHVSDFLYRDQSALLLVGIAAPFVANVSVIASLPRRGVDPTPFAFTITGLAFGYAMYHHQLFDLVPATRQLGRNAAIRQLEDGVVIVDPDHRIVYCNEAAGDLLETAPSAATGREIQSLLEDLRIDLDAADALAEVEHGDRVYEVRTSPITDRQERRIGQTVVFHDVTTRIERERRLAAQRDELARLEDLNSVLRGVNQALVSATTRSEIDRAVAERLAAADLYRTACIADVATWAGEADRWLVAGEDHESDRPPTVENDEGDLDPDAEATLHTRTPTEGAEEGTWAVVPIAYGRTVFGALGLYTDRETIGDRERAVLAELGETVGHAINAVESQQLLSAETVVELAVERTADTDPLVAAAADGDCQLDLAGLVPGSAGETVAYLRVDRPDTAGARDRLATASDGDVRTVREGEADGLLEWQVTGESLLGTLVEYGANVQEVTSEDGRTRYTVELASGADVRTLRDHLVSRFEETRVVSKRERARPVEEPDALTGDSLADLTDRQHEALEAAYRAGYFDWPRESTAEEIAESMGITAPTLHAHLRKAEGTMLTDLFEEPSVGD